MKKTFLRKIIKFSNYSSCLTLPKEAVQELGWDVGTDLEVRLDAKKARLIVVQKATDQQASDVLTPTAFSIERKQVSKPLVTNEQDKQLNPNNTNEEELTPLEEL